MYTYVQYTDRGGREEFHFNNMRVLYYYYYYYIPTHYL